MEIAPNILFHDRYRLVEKKGQGTYGEVWLARDEQLDNMEVAVKIYIALDERGMQEFGTEYRITYGLNHPNLLRAYHYDMCESHPYLVMPYCPKSATSYVGHIDEPTLWRFIRDVASGLAYLHGKDILHHDIKPDNILEDANGQFVISDFGISVKMRSTLRRNSTRQMVNTNPLAGSIAYMGPEMFASHAESVKATDIWALGATIYELATGELPFYGQGGAILLNGAELARPQLPYSEAFIGTMLDCLAKETWDRPTAIQLVARAQAALNGQPVDFGPRHAPTGNNVTNGDDNFRSTVKQGFKSNEGAGKQHPADMGGTIKEGATSGTASPEKKNNRLWLWVALAFLLIGGGIGGWTAYSKEQERQKDNEYFASCSSANDYRAYLRQYPNGQNADAARSRISGLESDSIAEVRANEAALAQQQQQPAPEAKPEAKPASTQASKPNEPKGKTGDTGSQSTQIAQHTSSGSSKTDRKSDVDEDALFNTPRKTTKSYPDGSTYDGYALPNGSKEGEGRFTDSHGNVYTGNWKNNKRNGYGRQTYADGSWYEGNWKDDQRSGNGEYHIAGGNVYNGNFSNNQINGQGTMTYARGEVRSYTGTWKDGKCTGSGTMLLFSGMRLVGDFVNGKLNGNGTIYNADNTVLESGYYYNGVKQR